jgi:hypothetical protein
MAGFFPGVVFAFLGMVAMAFVGCAGGPSVPDRPRISIYSTAYLNHNNQIVYSDPRRTDTAPAKAGDTREWTWNGDGVMGSPSIVIDLGRQIATFHKGGVEVGRSPVSTGREGYATPAGSFKVIQKNKNHRSNLYGDYVDGSGRVVKANIGIKTHRAPPGSRFLGASMPYFMRIHGGVGMHAGNLPGYPASHGCIRMPRGAAKRFFENAPMGTPVTVVH